MKSGYMVVVKQVVIEDISDSVFMSNALHDDLTAYGFYEVFYAAEQLWAIREGLA